MNLAKYISCSLLITTTTFAAETDHTSVTPPTITYSNFVMTLCVADPIQGWGDASGNFPSWLQGSKNTNLLKHRRNGEILGDLPFFLLTTVPAIDDNALRIDYDMPIPGSDLRKGPATLSLFRPLSDGEANYLKDLQPETDEETTARKEEWLANYYQMSGRTVGDMGQPDAPSRGPSTATHEDREAINSLFNSNRNGAGIGFIHTSGSFTVNGRTVSQGPYSNTPYFINSIFYDSYSTHMINIFDDMPAVNMVAPNDNLLTFDDDPELLQRGMAFHTRMPAQQPQETPQQRTIRDPEGFVRGKILDHTLSLSFHSLGDAGIAAIAPYFYLVATEVKILSLADNNIGVAGIQALVPHLSQLTNLKRLIIDNNPIGDDGLGILAPCLRNLPNLNVLIIERNNVTDAGIIALIPYLPQTISLGSVGNFLGDAGRSALSAAGFRPLGMDWRRPIV